MYDELIKALRCQGLHFEDCQECGCKYYDKQGWCDYFRLNAEAADAIEDLDNRLNLHRQGKIRHWIPVTVRLPNNQCNVLCDDDGRVVVGYYTDEEVGWHDMHSYKIYPTHWMPLPKPPESEKE